MRHIATITAYPLETGGFGAAMLDETTRQVTRREDLADLDAARYAVKMLAWDTFGPVRYAAIAKPGGYYANVWSA